MAQTLADQRAEWGTRIAEVGNTLRAESETNEELRQLSPATCSSPSTASSVISLF